jgi:DNA polymerase I-like protein with 3'-5' exonuclease and polymerase domains
MMANETTMLGQFARGEDIHMLRAMRMTGKVASDVTKEERKAAKPVSFGFLYGMGAPKFVDYARDSYDVHFEPHEAEAVRRGFFTDYPELLTWHDRQRRLARKHGRVQNPIGRIRHLPDIHSKDRAVQGEAERQAINSPVQSFASDLMLLALIRLHEMMPPQEALIVGTVHDSILAEIRNDVLLLWAKTIREVMEDMTHVKRKFGTEVTVPIVADIEVGSHWSEPTHTLVNDKFVVVKS